jgi:hypothetical protein
MNIETQIQFKIIAQDKTTTEQFWMTATFLAVNSFLLSDDHKFVGNHLVAFGLAALVLNYCAIGYVLERARRHKELRDEIKELNDSQNTSTSPERKKEHASLRRADFLDCEAPLPCLKGAALYCVLIFVSMIAVLLKLHCLPRFGW